MTTPTGDAIIITNAYCRDCGYTDLAGLYIFLDAETQKMTVRCKNQHLCAERQRERTG